MNWKQAKLMSCEEFTFLNVGRECNYIPYDCSTCVEEGRFFNFARSVEDIILNCNGTLYVVRVIPPENRVYVYKIEKSSPDSIVFVKS